MGNRRRARESALRILFQLEFNEADPEANSVGSKGLGEPPIIPTAAALANAVEDAIGVRVTDLPLTPDRVLDALRAQKEAAR